MTVSQETKTTQATPPGWHAADAAAVAQQLGVEPEQGLSAAEARSRLQTQGPNRLTAAKKESGLQAFLRQYRDVMRSRWLQVTLSTLLLQLTSWAVLVLALRGLEAGSGTVNVTWTESLAAFSFARVASFIPVTPGGLETVDAALAALLGGYGATSSQALAADLVWRAATYLPQVLLGALTFLWWRVTANRRTKRLTSHLMRNR